MQWQQPIDDMAVSILFRGTKPAIQATTASGCSDTRISGIRISGYPNIRIPGYPGYPDIRVDAVVDTLL